MVSNYNIIFILGYGYLGIGIFYFGQSVRRKDFIGQPFSHQGLAFTPMIFLPVKFTDKNV
jgi:hypothetical protein